MLTNKMIFKSSVGMAPAVIRANYKVTGKTLCGLTAVRDEKVRNRGPS